LLKASGQGANCGEMVPSKPREGRIEGPEK